MAGKILIVDDVATNRIVLKVKLSGALYDTVQCATGANALRLVREARPDLILLESHLPDMRGIDVIHRLRADPLSQSLPIVMLSSINDPALRLAALEAGADDVLTKPLDELVLLARLRSLLRARETQEELNLRESTCRDLGFEETKADFAWAARVAVVSASRERAHAWKRALAAQLPGAVISTVLADAALSETAGVPAPDAFVIEADLARKGDGLRLMSELRSRPTTRHCVICIALREEMRDTAAVALDLGANNLIAATPTSQIDAREAGVRLRAELLRKRVADRQRASVADGLRLAVTDPLTGLYNRRYALPHLARIAERSRTTGRPFAVMVLDLDRFKAINDVHGHAAGDTVLIEVAARLLRNLRDSDLVARIGGEEFLVAMPETPLETARSTAERLCKVIARTPMRLRDGVTEVSMTMSIGLTMGGGSAEGAIIEDLVSEADRALLWSKLEGRNQVTISPRLHAA
jgi:two-component system cell cycle response regulator